LTPFPTWLRNYQRRRALQPVLLVPELRALWREGHCPQDVADVNDLLAAEPHIDHAQTRYTITTINAEGEDYR
jgi:hypothetical protein